MKITESAGWSNQKDIEVGGEEGISFKGRNYKKVKYKVPFRPYYVPDIFLPEKPPTQSFYFISFRKEQI